MKRLSPLIIIVAVGACAGLVVWYLKASSTRQSLEGAPRPSATTLVGTSGPPVGAQPPHAQGPVEAPVMIEEFADFECQACAALHPVLKTLKNEFGDRLVIIFRESPLATLHSRAVEAAQAAEAAARQGKFWEMQNALFENQRRWHDASRPITLFEEFAAQLGLNIEQFRRDMAGSEVSQRIALDRQRAAWIGIDSTPTVFVNGRQVPFESLNLEHLRSLINDELAAAKN